MFKYNKKMHDNTKLLLLIFLTLSISTAVIILSLRPTKNTEAYPKRTGKMGWGCNANDDCKSNLCGQFDINNHPLLDGKKTNGVCCGLDSDDDVMKVEHKYNGHKRNFCTGLGKNSRCTYNDQCNSNNCTAERKCK
tara:strand:- start:513 stop:920 length:408 start_codon:yes stop_codon:yes gene_type:complete